MQSDGSGHDSKATRLARIAPRRSTRVSPRTITLYSCTEAGLFLDLFPLAPINSNDNGIKETDMRSMEVGATRFTNSRTNYLDETEGPTVHVCGFML